jgi:hypothetical protein
VIDNNLQSILHTHCVTKAQWKLWKLHLVVLCKYFASHSAHTFLLQQPKYENYIWLCCTQTLHSIVHIHLCLQSTTRTSWLCCAQTLHSILHTHLYLGSTTKISKNHIWFMLWTESVQSCCT